MKTGDLLTLTTTVFTFNTRTMRTIVRTRRTVGLLLAEPKWPRYGNYPRSFDVLGPDGRTLWTESSNAVIEKTS